MPEIAGAEKSGHGRDLRLKILVPDDYGGRVRELDCVKRHADFDLDIVPGPAVNRHDFVRRLADADALILIRERTNMDSELLDSIASVFSGKPKNIANPEVLAR